MKEAASIADQRYMDGNARPLEGVPIGIKDNIDTTDSPTTAGSPALTDNWSKFDSQIWTRLRDHLGCISAGKTNMNEFALGTTTYNEHYGHARNAYDETRIAGGSSGGSAGLVGTGAIPAALGTDHSGSNRIPAAFNGCVGYRPTVNRWPCEYGVKSTHVKDTCGPITQNLDDLVLIDELVTETRHKELPALKNITVLVPKIHFQESLDSAVETRMHEVL